MTASRSWSGVNGTGRRSYTPSERALVVLQMQQHVGRARKTTLAALMAATGLEGRKGAGGRTLRAILSDCDGVEFALYMPSDGLIFVAEFYEDAERTTRQLRSRATKMAARAARREAFVPSLPRRQGFMFDDELDEDDDDLE